MVRALACTAAALFILPVGALSQILSDDDARPMAGCYTVVPAGAWETAAWDGSVADLPGLPATVRLTMRRIWTGRAGQSGGGDHIVSHPALMYRAETRDSDGDRVRALNAWEVHTPSSFSLRDSGSPLEFLLSGHRHDDGTISGRAIAIPAGTTLDTAIRRRPPMRRFDFVREPCPPGGS